MRRQRLEVRYSFIQRHRRVWPITVQCRVLNVSVSGYHRHVARQASEAPRRHLSDEALLVQIKAVHATASMSRRGNGWENACSETLFGSLKVERLHGQRFITRRHATAETLAWLLRYNPQTVATPTSCS